MRSRTILLALPLLAAPAGRAAGPTEADLMPFTAEGLGLMMSVPAGAVSTTQVAGGGLAYLLTGGGAEPTWTMRLSTLTPPSGRPTAADLIDAHLEAVRATGAVTVVANEPRVVDGARGHLLYIRSADPAQDQSVSGWVIVPRSAEAFVVLSILVDGEAFPHLQPVLDACLATVRLRSMDELAAEHDDGLGRGRAFVETLTPQNLRSVVGPREWYRIYRPSDSGRTEDDTEVGFMSLQCLPAARGRLEPQRSPDSYSSLEAERGLMVVIEARAIVNHDSNLYLDVEGRYWMAWDRNQEAWSVRQTRRQGEASRTSAETGVRSLATLDVIHSSREELTRDPSQWTIPDKAYLSQPEVFLLGRLLPRESAAAGEMLFYYYESGSRRLVQRTDRWEPADDGSNGWVLATRSVLKPGTVTQVFDAQGRRVKRIDGDGTLTVRIDPDELQRLWRSKGLLAE